MTRSLMWVLVLVASSCVQAVAAGGVAKESGKADLAATLDAWIVVVEKDDAKGAAERFGKDEKAAAQVREHWAMVRRAHSAHDYRKLFDGMGEEDATKVGEGAKFKLGGHEYGHTHVDWEKTDKGWRVAAVWICR